ncbi:MAG: hypothetical protein AABW48_05635 [Nanoarchaeota archaeon]
MFFKNFFNKKRFNRKKFSKKEFNKKGLGVGEVFVFIVAALTFALIMIFGYKAITDFLQSGENVAFVQFKTNLESSVKRIYTEYGSVRVEHFTLPAKYSQICFVDLDAPYDSELCKKDLGACNIWEASSGYDSVGENVFLKPVAPKIKVHKLSINSPDGKDFLCLPIKDGQFTITLEGKGDRTEISPKLVSS